ncbi:MAG: ribonuclease P [Prevotellaceae bacterium]|nr:ribonuclease P [Prevotellaceae bacterium]
MRQKTQVSASIQSLLADREELAMIDFEQLEGIVGCFCTLLYPRKGQTEGTIVEDLGSEVIIQLTNGKEVTEYKDDIVICE